MNKDQFAFLTSTRFWAIVISSASLTLVDPALPTQAWYVSLGKFLGLIAGGFTVIRTIDRNTGDATIAASK